MALLTDDPGGIIYDHNIFIIQATTSQPNLSLITHKVAVLVLGWTQNLHLLFWQYDIQLDNIAQKQVM